MESKFLKIEVSPSIGGRILSLFNKTFEREFLWHNANLPIQSNKKGDDYDVSFWGGVDELLPNDIPEQINGNRYPDHGELWTTALSYEIKEDAICLSGMLKTSGIFYQRTMRLSSTGPELIIDYSIRNESGDRRDVLWKLHAALKVQRNDRIITSARKARYVYPESGSPGSTDEFRWPYHSGKDLSVVPGPGNSLEFLYLYETEIGEMKLQTADGCMFRYAYDAQVFPYQWCFASYGGFNGHYTVIFEPATNIPVSVNEAVQLGSGRSLEPGEEIKTFVRIYAGKQI